MGVTVQSQGPGGKIVVSQTERSSFQVTSSPSVVLSVIKV